ncbi:ROK family protein [Paenibacillus sp.]|jgi:predicted NBD/HSP70 family sugar kinase|uniref:ROK family transcriptional regulator n=1 Tax=Paenibacillus sp. TaxID=58172 RepID=UPI0028262A9A|nr:ROK family protein [Paenibacillus sp.]MDR0269403.1 ROK family protein [Paenibacillus sp.]
MEDKTVNIKEFNRNRIYKLLRQKQNLSKQDIVQHLQISLPTVTQNLNYLLQEKLIAKTGSIGNTGGRNAQVYSYISDAKMAIGLDITRNHITTVVVDLNGDIIHINRRRQKFETSDPYFRLLGDIIQEDMKKLNIDDSKILGVGIGVPGLITEDHETVFYGKILNFTGETLQRFATYIKYPAILVNDANAAGFSEIWATPDTRNVFYISLSNNIGGAVYIGNKVFAGENQKSGEIGHITIIPDGIPCYCGQKGCLEAYCSASLLADTVDGNLARFFEEVQKGNAEKLILWDNYLRHLSIAINNIRMLFDCDIILGGYVGAYMENYIDALRKLVADRNTFEDHADFVRICNYKTEAIAAGAALPFIDRFINQI